MSEQYLAALALLKSSYDQYGATFLDYVAPFVGDTIRSEGRSRITPEELRTSLNERYGMDFPVGVLNTLTRRLSRQGFGQRAHGAFEPDLERLRAKFDFAERRDQADQAINHLVEDFVKFSEVEAKRPITTSQAYSAITQYAHRNGMPILERRFRGNEIPVDLSLDELEYLAGRYVVYCFEEARSERETLVLLAKGSKLASVLYLPDPQLVDRKIDHLTAFLDTPMILSALGYQGYESEVATRVVLDLAYRAGIELAVFDHTLDEIEGVLEAVGRKVHRSGYHGRSLRGVEAHFLELGYNANDIKLLVGQLEKNLSSLRIRVRQRPQLTVPLSVDETSLTDELQREITYRSEDPMRHDLEALTGTYRFRQGRASRGFETARAVFVTPNTSLAIAARRFFDAQHSNQWPVAVTEDDFSTLLWLKQPMAAPDLPAQRLLADAYSALEPGLVSWESFLDELERLEEKDSVSEDDYYFLRYSSEARNALVEETLGGADAGVTAEVVHTVLARARGAVAEPIEEDARQRIEASEQNAEEATAGVVAATAERDDAVAARDDAVAVMHQLRRREERQKASARRFGEQWARRGRLALTALALIVVAVGVWVALPFDLGPQPESFVLKLIVYVAVGIVAVATVANLVLSWHFAQTIRSLELRYARRLESGRLEKLGFQPSDDLQPEGFDG